MLDIYCAKISPRAYRPAVLPPLAAKELYAQERAGTDVFADALIKQSGIHMPGSFVKLASGETAIAVGSGRAGTPIVVALSCGDGMPYIEGLKRNTAHSAHATKSVVPRDGSCKRATWLNFGAIDLNRRDRARAEEVDTVKCRRRKA